MSKEEFGISAPSSDRFPRDTASPEGLAQHPDPVLLESVESGYLTMKKILGTLFPAKADNTILGSRIPCYVFILLAVLGTVRSCIHILAPDAGLSSIAGLDLNFAGAKDVIFFGSQWGAEQLIYAIIQWTVILRYRSLVPAMWLVQFLETFLRMFVAHIKPIVFSHTPPGAYEDKIYIPLSLVMLGYSLWSASMNKGNKGA